MNADLEKVANALDHLSTALDRRTLTSMSEPALYEHVGSLIQGVEARLQRDYVDRSDRTAKGPYTLACEELGERLAYRLFPWMADMNDRQQKNWVQQRSMDFWASLIGGGLIEKARKAARESGGKRAEWPPGAPEHGDRQ